MSKIIEIFCFINRKSVSREELKVKKGLEKKGNKNGTAKYKKREESCFFNIGM